MMMKQMRRVALQAPTAVVLGIMPHRAFALPKYQFDDEQWQADRFQISMKTHKTNAEELINALPIV